MRQIREFISKFLLEMLIIVVGAAFSILWIFNGEIVALDAGDKHNKEHITLIRQEVETFRKENKEDHGRIIDILMKK